MILKEMTEVVTCDPQRTLCPSFSLPPEHLSNSTWLTAFNLSLPDTRDSPINSTVEDYYPSSNASCDVPRVAESSPGTDFIEDKVARALWIWVSPILLLIGTSGNGLSFVILRSCSFRKCSIAFTLSALAIVDTSVLFTTLVRQWIYYLTGFDVRVLLWSAGCKVHFFLTYYLGQLSSWTLVVVTTERVICVSMPFFAKTACTKTRIVGAWVLVATLLAIVNSHFFWTARYFDVRLTTGPANRTTDHHICYIAHDYRPFFYHFWYWMDYVLLSIIPFFVIIIGNVIITVCIVRALNFRNQNSPTNPFLVPSQSSNELLPCKPMTSSTAMLIGISILFLVTTTPSAIYFLVSDAWIADGKDLQVVARVRLGFAVANILHFANNALNFVLYCLTGSRFRRAFTEHFRRERERERVDARSRQMSRGIITIGTRTSNCVAATGNLELQMSRPP